MSLPVPLTVRVGDRHVTREVSAVGFRKEAIGGVRNVRLRLARPLDQVSADVAAYSRVYLYDARTAEPIAEARISDLGRSAGTSGQQWDIVAFGPAQHASDTPVSLIYFDRPDNKQFRRPKPATSTAQVFYYDEAIDEYGFAVRPIEGATVQTTWICDVQYNGLRRAGLDIGRIKISWDSLITDANWLLKIITRNGTGAATEAASAAANTAGGTLTAVVTTHFPSGDDVAGVRIDRITSAKTATENDVFQFFDFQIRSKLYNADGTVRASGYSNDYVLAHEVVNDLLGRVLDQYDGANAAVSTAGTHHIDQWAYPDGATPAQMLDDLMLLEPAMRWTTGPSNPATGLYSFSWEPWPTTVRYEVTLEDGGSFPQSAQELFNEVLVRWQDRNGQSHVDLVTGACPILDDAGITRRGQVDLGDEVGSAANAARAGANFLADHNVPANAGTLTVSRPIRDLSTGAMVQPFEIEPGELVRVRGVESSPDSLNASSNDGQTVFRIWSMEYDTDSNTAVLELDTYSRTTANAIARLIKRRTRRR